MGIKTMKAFSRQKGKTLIFCLLEFLGSLQFSFVLYLQIQINVVFVYRIYGFWNWRNAHFGKTKLFVYFTHVQIVIMYINFRRILHIITFLNLKISNYI